ncbi:MAG TPA: hypothetical protein VGG16_04640 [Streptosporangiaceae bacterium]
MDVGGGFLSHRGLIALSVGGAIAETGLLSVVAPGARALGPQATALPPLAAYHDLRWLFAFGQSWPAFIAVLICLLLSRSALDAVLVRLAWPKRGSGDDPLPEITQPRFMAAFWSCAVLTLLVWVVLSPVVTLMFGVALVPFSWPFLAAVPILLGSALMLSHGGVGRAWWRRLPAASTAAWLLAGFIILSAAAAAMPHLNTAGYLGVAALVGALNARAWYGLTMTAVKHATALAPQRWRWRTMVWEARRGWQRRTTWLPVAPVAAVLVLAMIVGVARLAFTGTVHIAPAANGVAAAGLVPAQGGTGSQGGTEGKAPPDKHGGRAGDSPPGANSAILVVAGFGSNCCKDANTLAAAEPGMLVRQFSYLGLTASGKPVSYHRAADLPIQELGDKMATQVEWLHAHTGKPVNIVAESEGTLGLYAMVARHPGLPLGQVVLLSPIVQPGQVGPVGVPGEALIELNDLIGQMSPYGSSGARALIDSVAEVGASYFWDIARDPSFRWLAVVPLADAVTMPQCPYPPGVVVVPAFHGGLLGNAQVRQLIVDYFAGDKNLPSSQRLRAAAQVISAAAAAWRMPDLHPVCPGLTK